MRNIIISNNCAGREDLRVSLGFPADWMCTPSVRIPRYYMTFEGVDHACWDGVWDRGTEEGGEMKHQVIIMIRQQLIMGT